MCSFSLVRGAGNEQMNKWNAVSWDDELYKKKKKSQDMDEEFLGGEVIGN